MVFHSTSAPSISSQISVFYIDFGNSEVLTDGANRLASLPSQLASVPAQATAFRLAGVALPPDEDDVKAAVQAFQVICYQGMIAVNTEYELEGEFFFFLSFHLEDLLQCFYSMLLERNS